MLNSYKKGKIPMGLHGWIIYNGFLPSEKFIDFAQMFKNAGMEAGHQMTVYTNAELTNIITDEFHWDGVKPDYVIFTDKDIYLAQQLEDIGIRVFNTAKTIEVSDDKIKTYQYLAQAHIEIPQTIVAPKTYIGSTAFSKAYITHIIETLSFPLIIKEAFGSFGEQVYFIENEKSLWKQLETVKEPFMFQQFISTSYGKDIRLQVVGDQVIAAIKRISETDFRANVTAGGRMETYQPSAEEKSLAIKASLAIGADFSGVDLLFGENDRPIVCEVNSNAHIRNLLDCTGINAAPAIIQYIEKELQSS